MIIELIELIKKCVVEKDSTQKQLYLNEITKIVSKVKSDFTIRTLPDGKLVWPLSNSCIEIAYRMGDQSVINVFNKFRMDVLPDQLKDTLENDIKKAIVEFTNTKDPDVLSNLRWFLECATYINYAVNHCAVDQKQLQEVYLTGDNELIKLFYKFPVPDITAFAKESRTQEYAKLLQDKRDEFFKLRNSERTSVSEESRIQEEFETWLKGQSGTSALTQKAVKIQRAFRSHKRMNSEKQRMLKYWGFTPITVAIADDIDDFLNPEKLKEFFGLDFAKDLPLLIKHTQGIYILGNIKNGPEGPVYSCTKLSESNTIQFDTWWCHKASELELCLKDPKNKNLIFRNQSGLFNEGSICKEIFDRGMHIVGNKISIELTKNLLESKPYKPQSKYLAEGMADKLYNLAVQCNIIPIVKHIASVEHIGSILEVMYGRDSLLSKGLPFVPAALSNCDIASGDTNAICCGPQTIDPRCYSSSEVAIIEFDVTKLDKTNQCIFYKQRDFSFFRRQAQTIKIGDKTYDFSITARLGPQTTTMCLVNSTIEKEYHFKLLSLSDNKTWKDFYNNDFWTLSLDVPMLVKKDNDIYIYWRMVGFPQFEKITDVEKFFQFLLEHPKDKDDKTITFDEIGQVKKYTVQFDHAPQEVIDVYKRINFFGKFHCNDKKETLYNLSTVLSPELMSYNVARINSTLILNFFRFIDNLDDKNKAMEIYTEINKYSKQEKEAELKQLLTSIGKAMTTTTEFNFYSAHQIDFNSVKMITFCECEHNGLDHKGDGLWCDAHVKEKFKLNLPEFLKELNEGQEVDIGLKVGSDIYEKIIKKSPRLIRYLIDKVKGKAHDKVVEQLNLALESAEKVNQLESVKHVAPLIFNKLPVSTALSPISNETQFSIFPEEPKYLERLSAKPKRGNMPINTVDDLYYFLSICRTTEQSTMVLETVKDKLWTMVQNVDQLLTLLDCPFMPENNAMILKNVNLKLIIQNGQLLLYLIECKQLSFENRNLILNTIKDNLFYIIRDRFELWNLLRCSLLNVVQRTMILRTVNLKAILQDIPELLLPELLKCEFLQSEDCALILEAAAQSLMIKENALVQFTPTNNTAISEQSEAKFEKDVMRLQRRDENSKKFEKEKLRKELTFSQLVVDAVIIFDKYYLQPYTLENSYIQLPGHKKTLRNGIIERRVHGATHASYVCCYIKLLHEFRKIILKKQSDQKMLFQDIMDKFKLNETEVITLLQYYGLFHDSARANEGKDIWNTQSASNCEIFLFETFQPTGQLQIFIKVLTAAAALKDNEFEFLAFLDKNELPKTYGYLRELIHDADCLEVMRDRHEYRPEQLMMYKILPTDDENAFFKEFEKLLIQIHELIYNRGDMDYPCKIVLNSKIALTKHSNINSDLLKKIQYEHAENTLLVVLEEIANNQYFVQFFSEELKYLERLPAKPKRGDMPINTVDDLYYFLSICRTTEQSTMVLETVKDKLWTMVQNANVIFTLFKAFQFISLEDCTMILRAVNLEMIVQNVDQLLTLLDCPFMPENNAMILKNVNLKLIIQNGQLLLYLIGCKQLSFENRNLILNTIKDNLFYIIRDIFELWELLGCSLLNVVQRTMILRTVNLKVILQNTPECLLLELLKCQFLQSEDCALILKAAAHTDDEYVPIQTGVCNKLGVTTRECLDHGDAHAANFKENIHTTVSPKNQSSMFNLPSK